MKSSRRRTWFGALIIFAVVGIFLGSMFQADQRPVASRHSQAKNDVTQIATAVVAFVTEYGRLPGTKTGAVGGELLAALMGHDPKLNPRGLVFLEVNQAEKGKSGVRDGYFVDPWGGKYQIALDGDYNNTVYADTNRIVVRKMVAVWSDPSLGPSADSLSQREKDRRHVTSWE